jgi:hypothetical protein
MAGAARPLGCSWSGPSSHEEVSAIFLPCLDASDVTSSVGGGKCASCPRNRASEQQGASGQASGSGRI